MVKASLASITCYVRSFFRSTPYVFRAQQHLEHCLLTSLVTFLHRTAPLLGAAEDAEEVQARAQARIGVGVQQIAERRNQILRHLFIYD